MKHQDTAIQGGKSGNATLGRLVRLLLYVLGIRDLNGVWNPQKRGQVKEIIRKMQSLRRRYKKVGVQGMWYNMSPKDEVKVESVINNSSSSLISFPPR